MDPIVAPPDSVSRKTPGERSSQQLTEGRRLLILSLRYAISPREYAALHRHVLLKGPASVTSLTPSRTQYDTVCNAPGTDDYIPSATRTGIRVFLLSNITLSALDAIAAQLSKRRGSKELTTKLTRSPLFRSPNFLFSLSVSSLVVFHRLLYRFFSKLRQNLSLPQARTFRLRHPKVSKLFLSRLSPSIGSSLAGFALLIHPPSDRRVTISVYTFVKALEYYYNRLEDNGWFQDRPWWFGSWLLFPITSGQLLYAFVFDRDCFPTEYGSFIMGHSKEYIQARPGEYPAHLTWPGTYDIVDSMGKIAGINFPPFNSPILYPGSRPLHKSLLSIAPIVAPAHPTITSLHCALLHPHEPSCLKTYLHFWASEFTSIAKFMTIIYAVAWLPRYRSFLRNPASTLTKLARSTLLTSAFITGSIGTSWAMTCFFQKTLPRRFLPKSRYWLGGLIGGLWAFVDSRSGRGSFLYSFRIGLISAWKVLVKRGLVKGIKNGDVYLFILSLAVINTMFDTEPHTVSGSFARKMLNSIRGKGMTDPVSGDQVKVGRNKDKS